MKWNHHGGENNDEEGLLILEIILSKGYSTKTTEENCNYRIENSDDDTVEIPPTVQGSS